MFLKKKFGKKKFFGKKKKGKKSGVLKEFKLIVEEVIVVF